MTAPLDTGMREATVEAFGDYGGRYVPETLIPALDELEQRWKRARLDARFLAELDGLSRTWAGRPTPLNLALHFAPGKRRYLKREDLLHTGARKLNNTIGQVLLARHLGKRGSSPKRAPANTGPQLPPSAQFSTSNASSTWARRTFAVDIRTSNGCAFLVPRFVL
jgi:tryptophan synthase beta subunit